MLERLGSLVEFAYENVPLYRKLYREKPGFGSMEDFRQLPCLTRSAFVLCSIEDVLSDVDEAMIILPPIENKTLFPFPRLESAEDRDGRYEVFDFLLKQTGVADGASFLVITDSSHSYYCGEMVSNLLYYGHPTWVMVLRDHSSDELREWIDRFEPDCLLLGLDGIPDGVAGWGIPLVFTINQYDQDISSSHLPGCSAQNGGCISHFDIYAVTELGWIGIRLPGGHYVYPSDHFHLEVDPQDNILTLTALESWLQPFIRYKTSDRGQVLGDNRFLVTYIGEH